MHRKSENGKLKNNTQARLLGIYRAIFSERMNVRSRTLNADHRMKRFGQKSQHGAAMVLTLFILSILTMVGLLAARSSTTEMRMAVNEMYRKQAFYAAEGVNELVSEIIEQNIACPNGFTENSHRGGLVQVVTPDFWKNETIAGRLPADSDEDGNPVRDMRIPIDGQDNEPHANVIVGGRRSLSRGTALQTASGYAGIGRSLANHGSHIIFDQIVQHKGRFNTEAIVKIQWRHVIGSEGDCRP